jgi:PAS domain S-box-containing protein
VGATAGSDEHYALRASEQRMQREFGQAPIGLVATSLTARRPDAYLAVNDTYCELMGYSRDEFSGVAFLGDVHPEEQPALEAQIQEIVSGRTGRLRAGTRMVRKDGEIVLVRLTTGPGMDADTRGAGFRAVLHHQGWRPGGRARPVRGRQVRHAGGRPGVAAIRAGRRNHRDAAASGRS